MVSAGLSPVVNKLELLLAFDQRAIATRDTEAITKDLKVSLFFPLKSNSPQPEVKLSPRLAFGIPEHSHWSTACIGFICPGIIFGVTETKIR